MLINRERQMMTYMLGWARQEVEPTAQGLEIYIFKRKNKIRIFNTMVKPVLYYGADTWRPTGTNLKKIQTFINSCL
jgi:hypothetical protein